MHTNTITTTDGKRLSTTSPNHPLSSYKMQRKGQKGLTHNTSPRVSFNRGESGSEKKLVRGKEEKSAMVVSRSVLRKGPWTEQEDLQLVWFVGLFGLNRTGKSCRLRWVNYLHPGLKRGRMTPQEEQLVLELHAKWGNRWSRIARKLPGRTDNEIKNYWRTHMRKKAQEEKRSSSSPSTSTSSSSSSEAPSEVGPEKHECDDSKEGSSSLMTGFGEDEEGVKGYPMDQLWNEIAASEPVISEMSFEEYNLSRHSMPSPMWEYCPESLWRIDDEEYKMLLTPDHDLSNS